VFAKLFGVI